MGAPDMSLPGNMALKPLYIYLTYICYKLLQYVDIICTRLKCVVEGSLCTVLGHNHCEILGVGSIIMQLYQGTLSIGENTLLKHRIGTTDPCLAVVDAHRNKM